MNPHEHLSPAAQHLHHALLAGQQYELLTHWRQMTEEANELRFRTPTPEGWVPTYGGVPHPQKQAFVYIYHSAYGVHLGVYTSADWEDKAQWVTDWHGDFEYIRPRFGWAVSAPEGGLVLVEPQPTHFFPPPPAPTPAPRTSPTFH